MPETLTWAGVLAAYAAPVVLLVLCATIGEKINKRSKKERQ